MRCPKSVNNSRTQIRGDLRLHGAEDDAQEERRNGNGRELLVFLRAVDLRAVLLRVVILIL